MKLFGKSALVMGVAGVLALASMSASQARVRPWVAGAAGFAAGAAVGAAANANAAYYGSGYYDEPAYAYTGDPAYAYSYGYAPGYAAPSYGYYPYDSSYGYNTNTTSPWQERKLEGRDY